MSLEKLEERVTELEIALAHQDRTVEALNAVVITQDAAIAKLTAEVDRLKNQVAQMLLAEPVESTRPPHY